MSERRARRERRWRRWRFAVLGTVVLVVLVGFGVVITDTVRVGSGAEPALARVGASRSEHVVTPAEHRCRTPLTPEAPLRLWIGGDSLAWALGSALGKSTAATGVVAPVFESRPSSGLTNRSFFDWPTRAAAEMARLDPEVVVFIIGTNDWAYPPGPSSATASTQTTWRTAYAALVEEMLASFGNRTVYWIGAPILQDPRQEAGASAVSEVARDVVAQHTDAAYVDAHALFAGPDGKYTPSFDAGGGRRVVVRTPDGIHFTPEGGERLANTVFDALDAQCRLRAQAVAGAARPVVQSEGSCCAPNFGSSGSTSSGGGSTSSGTSPPSPASAPLTAPPTQPPVATTPPPGTATQSSTPTTAHPAPTTSTTG